MPRKQRFKPSRKPKPVLEGNPTEQVARRGPEDIEAAQSVRSQHSDAGAIEGAERPK